MLLLLELQSLGKVDNNPVWNLNMKINWVYYFFDRFSAKANFKKKILSPVSSHSFLSNYFSKKKKLSKKFNKADLLLHAKNTILLYGFSTFLSASPSNNKCTDAMIPGKKPSTSGFGKALPYIHAGLAVAAFAVGGPAGAAICVCDKALTCGEKLVKARQAIVRKRCLEQQQQTTSKPTVNKKDGVNKKWPWKEAAGAAFGVGGLAQAGFKLATSFTTDDDDDETDMDTME
jgi:hypothetical protein